MGGYREYYTRSAADRGSPKLPRSSQTRSSPVIVAMLLASLALTAVLAWQAQQAATSQRQLAEQVLIDYSSLIADEFVRRATTQLGYYGYYNLIGQLQAANRENPAPPSMADLQNNEPRHSSRLASGIVFYDKKTAALRSQGGMDPDISSRILNTLQNMDIAKDAMQPFAILSVTENNRYWSPGFRPVGTVIGTAVAVPPRVTNTTGKRRPIRQ